jgi:hypothetical protein
MSRLKNKVAVIYDNSVVGAGIAKTFTREEVKVQGIQHFI